MMLARFPTSDNNRIMQNYFTYTLSLSLSLSIPFLLTLLAFSYYVL